MGLSKQIEPEVGESLLKILEDRFEKNMKRHLGMTWENILLRIKANPKKLWTLSEMERTGGEPDVVSHDLTTGDYIFSDCSAESPKGRRSVCYDREALNSRKEFKPDNDAITMAADMGVEILNEYQYKELQKLGEFDTKTSSWIKTPKEIRKLGGAIFADRRYNSIFIYHNSADSYYGVRGFRSELRV